MKGEGSQNAMDCKVVRKEHFNYNRKCLTIFDCTIYSQCAHTHSHTAIIVVHL